MHDFAIKLASSLPLIQSQALFYAYMITSFDYYSQPASLSCCCQSVFDFSLCTPKDIFTKKDNFESPSKLTSFVNLNLSVLATMRVPEGDLHCQGILSIFPAGTHQIYANILALIQCLINLLASFCFYLRC